MSSYEIKCDFRTQVDTLDEALRLMRLLTNGGARYIILGVNNERKGE